MNKFRRAFLLSILCLPSALAAQERSAAPPVSTVFAVLTKSVASKDTTVEQVFILRTLTDISVDGAVVIPKGSDLRARVTEAHAKDKEHAQAGLSLVVDWAATRSGAEIPVQAIIAAVAAPPPQGSLTDDPTYGMMHSVEPTMVGSSVTGTTSTGSAPANSRVGSTAAIATADVKGGTDLHLLLRESSQGAYGYDGLSLTWQLASPPPVTVFNAKGKSVDLKAGTQMLLRMTPPRRLR
jgi:hypothetical protein